MRIYNIALYWVSTEVDPPGSLALAALFGFLTGQFVVDRWPQDRR